jgi:hypothetical protein
MQRHIALPALALMAIAVGLAFSSFVFWQETRRPIEEQFQYFSSRTSNSERSVEHVKSVAIAAIRTQRQTYWHAGVFFLVMSLATSFSTAWLVVGCYRQAKKAQQGAFSRASRDLHPWP